jgi:hypothetical protein
MLKPTFLTKRADGHAKIAENYRQLEGICIKFGLVPKSGDLFTDESWPIPVNEDDRPLEYWPQERAGSVLLTKPGMFPEYVAAVRVNADGYHGHVIGAGGNHNLYANDLKYLLERAGFEEESLYPMCDLFGTSSC